MHNFFIGFGKLAKIMLLFFPRMSVELKEVMDVSVA